MPAPTAIAYSPSFPTVGDSQSNIHNKEAMNIRPVSSGKRCSGHDKCAWSASPGRSFSIFIEMFSDQLAHEAHAASPLNYEHDDKENMADDNHADMDELPSTYAGVSVIPEAQCKQSSEDRVLAHHRALISSALYDDPLPQTYGLDGTHCSGRGDPDAFLEGMSILASGAHLPLEKRTD